MSLDLICTTLHPTTIRLIFLPIAHSTINVEINHCIVNGACFNIRDAFNPFGKGWVGLLSSKSLFQH